MPGGTCSDPACEFLDKRLHFYAQRRINELLNSRRAGAEHTCNTLCHTLLQHNITDFWH